MHFEGQKFTKQIVDLDGNTFDNCKLFDCTLRFSGRAPIAVNHCEIAGCKFMLGDSAMLTATFLKAIYHGFGESGRTMVEQLFAEIRRQPEPNMARDGKLDFFGRDAGRG
jgi:hypothetical protein